MIWKKFVEKAERYLRKSLPGRVPAAVSGSTGLGGEATITQVVNGFILEAIQKGASDVHLEPGDKSLRIRLRIDGLLYEAASPPLDAQPLILSRLKILAGMDIAEKRLPQDGRIQFILDEGAVNIRVSTLPTIKGEKIVLRLLNRERIIMDLDQLGMRGNSYAAFKGFIASSHGLILVTGPTGCGKSTTLYSTINCLNSPCKNLITVEDPVEFSLEGVNQVQVNNKTGLTFGRALRNILRQDPNIIMIGEIRDTETAEIATRAALTGHLVLSTLHTNDAPRAISRLLDMGVKEYLLVSSLVGVVAQRLVRRLCPLCREKHPAKETERKYLEHLCPGIRVPDTIFQAGGCSQCNGTGYRGRLALHQVMACSEAINHLILKGAPLSKLERQAEKEGLIPLSRDAACKVLEGLTTLPEVIQTICSSQPLAREEV